MLHYDSIQLCECVQCWSLLYIIIKKIKKVLKVEVQMMHQVYITDLVSHLKDYKWAQQTW